MNRKTDWSPFWGEEEKRRLVRETQTDLEDQRTYRWTGERRFQTLALTLWCRLIRPTML